MEISVFTFLCYPRLKKTVFTFYCIALNLQNKSNKKQNLPQHLASFSSLSLGSLHDTLNKSIVIVSSEYRTDLEYVNTYDTITRLKIIHDRKFTTAHHHLSPLLEHLGQGYLTV